MAIILSNKNEYDGLKIILEQKEKKQNYEEVLNQLEIKS